MFYSDYNSKTYMRFPNSNFVSGDFMVYRDDACQSEPGAGLNAGPLGYVHASTQADAASLCSNVHNRDMEAYRDFTKYSSQVIWWCLDPDADTPNGGGGDSDKPSGAGPSGIGADAGGPSVDEDIGSSAPGRHSCQTLVQATDLKMTATYGLTSGIQCNRIGAGGVFNPAVTSHGVQDAVDVWGYAEQGFQLCFPKEGSILFVDASTLPRSVASVEPSYSGGYTCATLNRPGIVALVGAATRRATSVSKTVSTAASASSQVTTQYIRPGTYDSLHSAIPLNNCIVTPSTTLRLRAAPWGFMLGRVWEASKVKASARTPSWYNIDYKGQEGWIAAWLSEAEGRCFGAGPGHAALPLVPLPGKVSAQLTGA